MIPFRSSEPSDDDRGVVLILVAIAMVAILIIAAMALDLGAKRADRRSDQSVADLASLAAGSFLAGNGQAKAISNPFAACKAALTSARTNISDFSPSQNPDDECAKFGSDAKVDCTAGSSVPPVPPTEPQEATFTDPPRYSLVVRYPIPTSELVDARFSGAGGGVNDGTDRCERMRITFGQTNPTGFARVIGVNEQSTLASSVVRANTGEQSLGVAALLLLERVGCGTLQTSGGGGAGDGVVAEAPPVPPAKANQPGWITSDSAGIVGSSAGAPLYDCGSGTSGNPGNYVVYGTALPSGTGPSITAAPALDSTLGIIGLYSRTVGGKTGAVFPGGLSVDTSNADVSSRQPADDKYNGGYAQISTLHSNGYLRSTNDPLVGTDTVLSTAQECKGNITDSTKLAGVSIYVDCPRFEPGVNVFPNATTFVVRGNINIKSGNLLSLPVVKKVYIRGCAVSGCGGPNKQAISIANNGALLINTDQSTVPEPSGTTAFAGGTACSARRGPGAGGSTTNTTQLATFSGNLPISGFARLCQTTVYLGKNSSSYVRQSVDSTLSGPENYPTITQCSATLPCPKNSGYDASVSVGGSTDWSAPNQLSVQPIAADFVDHPFEDLALWSETDALSSLKGQGLNVTEGVYFLPNANATFTGLGLQPIGINAQYFVRSLDVKSQGTLRLKPNPADAIPTPVPGSSSLIR